MMFLIFFDGFSFSIVQPIELLFLHIILNEFARVENGQTPYLLLFYYNYKPKTMDYINDQFPSFADFFLSVGLGIGRTDTPEKTNRKSMSNERTF